MTSIAHQGRRVAAWLTAAVTISMLVAAYLLSRGGSATAPDSTLSLFTSLGALASVIVGAVIIDRKGNHLVGWLFCLSGVGWGWSHLAHGVAVHTADGSQLAGQDLMLWGATWGPFLAFGLAPVLAIYVFPDGKLASRGWRWFFTFALTVVFVGSVGYAFAPGPIEDIPSFDNPFGVEGATGEIMFMMGEIGWPLLLFSSAGGALSLRQRRRRASLEERQQIKWVLFAGSTLVAFVTFWGVAETLGHPEIAAAGAGLFLPLLPIAIGTAILKYRLYDIDVLINRTLVYGSLSAVLGLVYLGTVVLFQGLLSSVTAESDVAVAASTLLVAALFGPVRRQVQRFIDLRFYRQKYDAASTLEGFSVRLRDQIDLEALQGEMLDVVGQTLQPAHASVWLRAQEDGSG